EIRQAQMIVDILHGGVELQRLFQLRDGGAKLAQPDLRQPQIKARIGIIRREVDGAAKVPQRLEIIALAVLDNAFSVFQLRLLCGPPEARWQQRETAPEHTSTPDHRRQPWTD